MNSAPSSTSLASICSGDSILSFASISVHIVRGPTQSDDNVDQSRFNNDHFFGLFAGDGGGDLFTFERLALYLLFVGVCGDYDSVFDLSVDLNGQLDLFFFDEFGVVGGPGLAGEGVAMSELL